MNQALVTTFSSTLESFDNLTLGALKVTVQGLGRVPKGIKAYGQALRGELIHEDGNPLDLEALRTAIDFEFNRRVKAGTIFD